MTESEIETCQMVAYAQGVKAAEARNRIHERDLHGRALRDAWREGWASKILPAADSAGAKMAAGRTDLFSVAGFNCDSVLDIQEMRGRDDL